MSKNVNGVANICAAGGKHKKTGSFVPHIRQSCTRDQALFCSYIVTQPLPAALSIKKSPDSHEPGELFFLLISIRHYTPHGVVSLPIIMISLI